MFSNKRIWLPHDENNYQIASKIIEHSKQKIGITFWSFAIINKSMILTVGLESAYAYLYFQIGSFILTYLILILQMTSDVKQ
jgi:hypothetical protein